MLHLLVEPLAGQGQRRRKISAAKGLAEGEEFLEFVSDGRILRHVLDSESLSPW